MYKSYRVYISMITSIVTITIVSVTITTNYYCY